MKKKLFLVTLSFFIGLLACEAPNIVYAEESDNFLKSSLFFNDSVPAIGLMSDGESSNYQDYTSAERTAIIGLNFLFGAGSYSTGHIGHGLLLTLMEAGGIVLVALPSIAGWELGLSGKSKDSSSSKYYDDRVTPETNMAILCWVGGGLLLITDVVYSIIWPRSYHRAQAKSARLDDISNWNVGFYPNKEGKIAGQISFTAHF